MAKRNVIVHMDKEDLDLMIDVLKPITVQKAEELRQKLHGVRVTYFGATGAVEEEDMNALILEDMDENPDLLPE